MNKSHKLAFIKNERKDKDPDLHLPMYTEARKAIALCKFIQVGKINLSDEPGEINYFNIDRIVTGLAYVFTLDMIEDGPGAESKYIVAFTKRNDKTVAYVYGTVYVDRPSWAFIMRVDFGQSNLSFHDPLKIKKIQDKYPADAYINRENLVKRLMGISLNLVGSEYVLENDLTKTLVLRDIPYLVRHTYNNYRHVPLSDSGNLSSIIEYTYEGSIVNLEREMLEELPFTNFYLKIKFTDSNILPIWTMFDNGKLHAIVALNDRSSKFSIGYIDLNNLKIGSPIGVNINMVNEFRSNDGYDIQDVAYMLNVIAKSFLEFMYKFIRLIPYSENVSKSHNEHVTHVVNNTSIHKIIVLNPDSKKRSTQGHKGGRHASPREHERIGHKRYYKSGKVTFVKSTIVNEGCIGKVKKTYVVN